MEFFITSFILFVIFYLLYQVRKHGGVKGALYGGKLEKTIGSVDLEKRGPVAGSLSVNVISTNGIKKIALGLTHKSALSYQLTPATLDRREVEKLISYLQEALK